MILAALGLELRTLLRSPLRLAVVFLVLGTGALVIAQGQRDVQRWREVIDAARAEQEASVAEARGYLASEGRHGPEDRPWIDLTQAHWQDWYAATRLVREPAPLAGIAFASPEEASVAVRINRYADPLLAQGAEIENPELAAAGGLDLATVLALLLPLLILALGVEVGGHERASGILPLVRVQSGRDRGWILARCLAVGVLGAATGLMLVAAAALVGGAGFGITLVLAGVVLAYVALWTALLSAVALFARHPSQGAVALGAAWITLCVLVPAVGVERAAALSADDFALDLTVEARDAGQALRELEESELFVALLRRFPELEDVVPEDRSRAARSARDGLEIAALEERLAGRESVTLGQTRLVDAMSVASPAVAFTRALEGLAGRGPVAAHEFRRSVVAAAAGRMERYLAFSWSSAPLVAEDFEATLAATPERIESRVIPPGGDVTILVGWTLFLAALAGLLSRRGTGVRTSTAASSVTRSVTDARSAGAARSAR